MVILKTDGLAYERELEHKPELKELQAAVDGGIELVPYFSTYEGRECIAYCNGEGKLEGRPFNQRATRLWAEQLGVDFAAMADWLVGDIVILQGDRTFMRSL